MIAVIAINPSPLASRLSPPPKLRFRSRAENLGFEKGACALIRGALENAAESRTAPRDLDAVGREVVARAVVLERAARAYGYTLIYARSSGLHEQRAAAPALVADQ